MKNVSTQDLVNLLHSYRLSADAEDYVIQTLNTDPSREVGQFARTNVSGAYSSPSQGITIQYESHTSELAWLVRWELDDDVVGFRDQPPQIDIHKQDKNGVMRLSRYTPDFLVFRSNTIRVVEVKPEGELTKLAIKYPEQWQHTDGVWRYMPALQAFRRIGLEHEVCSLDNDRSIETNNVKLLVQAQRVQQEIDPAVKASILSALTETAWLTIS